MLRSWSVTHYADLERCSYFGATDAPLLAVGWLDPEHPYTKGTVDRELFEALACVASYSWQPLAFGGRHACAFCVFTGGPSRIEVADTTVKIGASNVFVPAPEAVYVAPSLVLHYIDAHGYAPPDEFQRAVAACPPTRSMEYLKGIRRHGVHRLASPPKRE